MLFAAGLGTRLRPATDLHPKPCIPLLGIPLGYYLFPYFEKLKIEALAVNTFHLPQQIHNLYKSVPYSIQFSDEINFIKGSGGGLKQAEPLFQKSHNSVLVCNSDEVLFTKNENFLVEAQVQHEEQKALATLIVIKHPEAGKKFGGIWTDEKGNVKHIGKDPVDTNLTPWHFVGAQFFSPEIFSHLKLNAESNIFYDVLIHMLNQKKVQIFRIEADWYETGNLADYTDAKFKISENLKTKDFYQQHFQSLQKLPRSQIGDLT